MTKQLLPLLFAASLFAPGCDDAQDPELAEMIELCDELEDCDEAIDAMLAAEEEEAEADAVHDGPSDLTTRRGCTHCGDRPRGFAAKPNVSEGDLLPRVSEFTVPLPTPDPHGPRFTNAQP